MRVLHLNPDPGIRPGQSKGAAVHVQAMRKAFAQLGAQVLSLDESDEAKIEQRLEQAWAEGGLGLLYERFALHAYAGGEFARRKRLAHVLEVNSPLDEEAARFRPRAYRTLDTARLRALIGGATRLLCVSSSVAAWALRRGGREEQILVAGNGVDGCAFHPARRALGLLAGHTPPGAFVVGFHGRLRPWHGFERLVEAVARLRARGLPIHLLLIGKGEFAACIGDRLPRACWTHVPWCEYDEVGALVATFDVLPLCYDPTQPCYFSPLKLLEGMAAGALAVVPALGDLAETVLQGRAGVIYDPRDPGGLENAIAMAYQCPSLRSTLTGVARRVAEARSWRSIAQGVLAGTAEAPR